MQTIEHRTIDKSKWDRGPWDDEPDKRQWQDEATGLPCLIVRNACGSLCGYVGVAAGHPAFEKDYNDEGFPDVNAHGGITFCDFCQEHAGAEESGICHVPSEGEPDRVWWIGFDCAHYMDISPGTDASLRAVGAANLCSHKDGCAYRDFAYVANECQQLASQLAAIK